MLAFYASSLAIAINAPSGITGVTTSAIPVPFAASRIPAVARCAAPRGMMVEEMLKAGAPPIDPFSSPVFADPASLSVAAAAADPAVHAQPAHNYPALVTGLLCYGLGMWALTSWDNYLDEKIEDPRMRTSLRLPELRPSERKVRDERAKLARERERETVRGFTEWPTLDELKDSCLYLGSSTGLNHFLCSPSGHAKKPGDSCVDSVSFSEHYGVPFLLCTRSAVA